MNLQSVEEIAKAVLYEGYMLYPYCPSSVKNQQRWNFGVLCPQSYSVLQDGSESSLMQTECLLRAGLSTRLSVKLRFLQIVQRTIGRLHAPTTELDSVQDGDLEFVDRLELEGHIYQPWQEAVEQSLTIESLDPHSLHTAASQEFNFRAGNSSEPLRDADDRTVGAIVRHWQAVSGSIEIRTAPCRDGLIKLTVRVQNRSDFDPGDTDRPSSRETALLHSLVSAHLIMGVENGEFLSLLDPPASCLDLAEQCENRGVWPVLAGDGATTLLASPIILYDYPKVAPESVGNLFDGTEIDEILSLRILTLTDQEKQEIRQSDARARELLERTEGIPDEQFMKLHGVLRSVTLLKEDTR